MVITTFNFNQIAVSIVSHKLNSIVRKSSGGILHACRHTQWIDLAMAQSLGQRIFEILRRSRTACLSDNQAGIFTRLVWDLVEFFAVMKIFWCEQIESVLMDFLHKFWSSMKNRARSRCLWNITLMCELVYGDDSSWKLNECFQGVPDMVSELQAEFKAALAKESDPEDALTSTGFVAHIWGLGSDKVFLPQQRNSAASRGFERKVQSILSYIGKQLSIKLGCYPRLPTIWHVDAEQLVGLHPVDLTISPRSLKTADTTVVGPENAPTVPSVPGHHPRYYYFLFLCFASASKLFTAENRQISSHMARKITGPYENL